MAATHGFYSGQVAANRDATIPRGSFHDAMDQPETAPGIRFANITTLRLLVDCWILHGLSRAPASLAPQSENTNIQHPRPPHTVGCVLSQTHSAGRTARATATFARIL